MMEPSSVDWRVECPCSAFGHAAPRRDQFQQLGLALRALARPQLHKRQGGTGRSTSSCKVRFQATLGPSRQLAKLCSCARVAGWGTVMQPSSVDSVVGLRRRGGTLTNVNISAPIEPWPGQRLLARPQRNTMGQVELENRVSATSRQAQCTSKPFGGSAASSNGKSVPLRDKLPAGEQ